MKTLGVVSQKGGAGKTTIAVHLAVAAQRRGLSVLVFDTDPQASASVWARYRKGEAPEVVKLDAERLPAALAKLRALDAPPHIVIIDSAPHAGPDAAQIAGCVDRVLIPVRPSLFDLDAARSTVDIVKNAKADALFVLSACPPRAPEIAMAKAALGGAGVPLASAVVHDRRLFARSLQSGQAVQEVEPMGPAANEINSLLDEVLK